MVEYLDKIGLAYLWGKLKALLNSKVDKVSSTDNAIVRFDGTGGKIQNSGATINDSGHITAAKFVTIGGTPSQFLKANGSVDNTVYLPASGNAASATKATQDGSGNNIEATYQKKSDVTSIITDSDIGLANAIKTLVNESDGKYDSLSDTIDNLIDNSLRVSLSISPNTIFVGDSSTLVFSAMSKDSASSIIIKDGNGTQIASGSGTSLVGSKTVIPNSEGVLWYYVTAVVNGTTISSKSYVNCVRKIYYGSGTNYTNATTVSDAKQAPNGKYTISVNSANNYIYFVVPSSMTISKVLMNGLSMPMQATSVQKDGKSYTAYQSVNGYDVGTYNLDVE